MEDLLRLCCEEDCVVYTDIDKYTLARMIGQGSTRKYRRYRRRRPPRKEILKYLSNTSETKED